MLGWRLGETQKKSKGTATRASLPEALRVSGGSVGHVADDTPMDPLALRTCTGSKAVEAEALSIVSSEKIVKVLCTSIRKLIVSSN